MITYTQTHIFDVPDYSVILNQVNAKGWMNGKLTREIASKWPKVFAHYNQYCRQFADGHEDELIGTFCGVNVSPKLIVCNAIVQQVILKAKESIDYDAWEKVCKKIARQTAFNNERTGSGWTIHAQKKIGSPGEKGYDEQLMEIFEESFGESSPVNLVLHAY